jgi:hypothetical protein
MEIIEKKIIDKIEIAETNSIQVRTASIIEKDGVQIAKTYQRHVLNPTNSVENEDPRVQAIANAIWTNEVIAKYKQDLEKLVATK